MKPLVSVVTKLDVFHNDVGALNQRQAHGAIRFPVEDRQLVAIRDSLDDDWRGVAAKRPQDDRLWICSRPNVHGLTRANVTEGLGKGAQWGIWPVAGVTIVAIR